MNDSSICLEYYRHCYYSLKLSLKFFVSYRFVYNLLDIEGCVLQCLLLSGNNQSNIVPTKLCHK